MAMQARKGKQLFCTLWMPRPCPPLSAVRGCPLEMRFSFPSFFPQTWITHTWGKHQMCSTTVFSFASCIMDETRSYSTIKEALAWPHAGIFLQQFLPLELGAKGGGGQIFCVGLVGLAPSMNLVVFTLLSLMWMWTATARGQCLLQRPTHLWTLPQHSTLPFDFGATLP